MFTFRKYVHYIKTLCATLFKSLLQCQVILSKVLLMQEVTYCNHTSRVAYCKVF
jgi:hypothetical protein